LKTLEKINRKGNRNSRKKEKAISAQSSPLSPARARAPPVSGRQVPPIGANQRDHSSPSLSHCTVGSTCRCWFPRVRTLSLSLPHGPHLSAVPNLSPTISPPWTRPRPRVFRPRPSPPRPARPPPLSHLHPLPSSLALSLSLCPREHGAPPLPADAHCLFRGHRRARAPYSATMSSVLLSAARDTLRCALSLPVVSGPRSPEHFLRSRSLPPSPRRTLAPPSLLRNSSASA
jgi:hypothetical protein